MPKMWMLENCIHSCSCGDRRGYKLMWNMSSEEQQALKRSQGVEKKKNHGGFNTWGATSVLCSNKTGVPGFTVRLWIILPFELCYHGLSIRCCYSMEREKSNVTEKGTLGVMFYNIWSRVGNPKQPDAKADTLSFKSSSSVSYFCKKSLTTLQCLGF